MSYEKLLNTYDDIFIKEMNLQEVAGLKGLYIDGCIMIDKDLTQAEKGCVLCEEIGHHLTSTGNILNQVCVKNRKQEIRARSVGYDLKIGLIGIISAFEHGCINKFEMSEYLEVTEEFLSDAIACYRSRYGQCVPVDNYTIYFEPCLSIMKAI